MQSQLAFPFRAYSGPIVFDQVDFTFVVLANGDLHFDGCPDVTFRECVLPRLRCAASRVALQDCTTQGYGTGGRLHLVSGSLAVAGGYTTGARTVFFSVAQPAIRVDGGELLLAGNAVIEALHFPAQPAPGIATTSGLIRRAPSVVVTGTPPITGPATALTSPLPSLSVSHTATTVNVTLRGQPGDLLLTLAGPPTSPYPTPWGDAWLLPSDPILDVSVLPAGGSSAFSMSFPAVPSFFLLTLQSVAIDAAGGLQIGLPSRWSWN